MDNLKDIEVKAIYRSLIRNDYPSKLRKSFVEKVMNKIKSSEKNSPPSEKESGVKLTMASGLSMLLFMQ